MTEPNVLLDALLEETGVSHSGLAARLNRLSATAGKPTRYDHTAVARWIRDHATPRGNIPDLICEIIGAKIGRTLTLADIGMERGHNRQHAELPLECAVDHATALIRGDLKRVAFLQGASMLAGAAAVAPVFEWENPPDDVDVSHRGRPVVGLSDVRTIAATRASYEQMYRRVGGVPVRPRVVAFLNSHAAPLLRGSYDDTTGRELFRSVGGLMALAGICAYDADRQALAQKYLFHALRMAKASRNRAFGGYVVALLANQAMYHGNYRHVIQYSETALRATRGNLTPALITDLHTLQAKAYARMGDRQGCHEHMRYSESTAAQIRLSEEPPETGYVQPGLLECQHAEALHQLGDLGAALPLAEEGVRTADVSHMRGQAHRLATLALVLAEGGEVERAADVAGKMLDRAQGMESGRIHERVLTVADALRRHGGGPEVRDVLDRSAHQLRATL